MRSVDSTVAAFSTSHARGAEVDSTSQAPVEFAPLGEPIRLVVKLHADALGRPERPV